MFSQKKRIRVLYLGGIGNQLFQYFAALDVSSRHQIQLVHDFQQIDGKRSHKNSDIRIFHKLFEDQEMSIPNNITKYLDKVIISIVLRIKDSEKFFNAISDRNIRTREGNFCRNPFSPRMIGYFQDSRFLEKSTSLNILRIQLEQENSTSASRKLNSWNKEKFVCIHVRGGDFLSQGSAHTVLTKSYYLEALRLLEGKIGASMPIIVFSNDRPHAEITLGALNGRNLEYFDDRDFFPAEVLSMMAKASAHIISNSTFSYWGARLSNSSNMVICPSSEILKEPIRKNYYPSDWVQVRKI